MTLKKKQLVLGTADNRPLEKGGTIQEGHQV